MREMTGLHGDNGVVIDLARMSRAVAQADIVVVGFEFWPQRLLIDLRPDRERDTPPIIEVVEPLPGVQERQIWLEARRPGLPPPENFLFFVWPHTVGFLERSALAVRVRRRIEREQAIDVREDLERVFAELRALERRETLAVLRGGEGYETAWSREGAGGV
jgi:hypothetical protein